MPRVLYLIALENVLDNAIFENQVRRMLVAVRGENAAEVTILVLLPWLEVTRRGVYSNFSRHRQALNNLRNGLKEQGIGLVVRRAFVPSAFFNMRTGLLRWFVLSSLPALLSQVRRFRPDIVHCRYYYAARLALAARRLAGAKYRVIFDLRSLLPEQGLVNGQWSQDSRAFRDWKALERKMLLDADRVVSVSPAMTGRVSDGNPGLRVETIPNFVDLERFRPDENSRRELRRELGIEERRVLVFCGTLGGRYPGDRIAECVRIYFSAFGPESFFLLLSPSDEKRLAPLAGALLHDGLERGRDWECHSVESGSVSRYLNAADWSLLALADSMNGVVQPLKFAEYLALGLPVLTHPANEELVHLTRELGVGEVLDSSSGGSELRRRLDSGQESMRAACLRVARESYGLQVFAARYASIYRKLSERGPEDG